MIYHLFELEPVTSIDESVDLNPYIHKDADILSFKDTKVTGKLYYESKTATFDLEVTTVITQACAITLLPVEYELSFHADIVFGGEYDDYDYILEDPIKLAPIIYAYAMTEKPYSVFHPSADRSTFEEDEKIHPAFEGLKNLNKK